MKATSISSHESDFFNLKKDTDGKVFDITEVTKKIKGTEEEIVFYKCRINEKYKDDNPDKIKPFFKKPKNPPQKKQIVLHFTAGYLRGDIATLTRGSSKDKEGKLIIPWHVSVPFVIARNGKIFQLWNENKYWAKHLGLKGNANTTCNQKTIGIELSNIGPLLKKGKNLVTTYGKNQVYCGLEDDNYYTKKGFREHRYFASFSEKQYESLIILLRYLTKKHDISPTFLPEDSRYLAETDSEKLLKGGGIVSHVNYRGKNKWKNWDKWDIGPAFDWERVISGLEKVDKKPPSTKEKEKTKISGNFQFSNKSGKKPTSSKNKDPKFSEKGKDASSKNKDPKFSEKSGKTPHFSKKKNK